MKSSLTRHTKRCFELLSLEMELQRRRRNHAGEAERSPLSTDFNSIHKVIENLGATAIGSMIRMRSDVLLIRCIRVFLLKQL